VTFSVFKSNEVAACDYLSKHSKVEKITSLSPGRGTLTNK